MRTTTALSILVVSLATACSSPVAQPSADPVAVAQGPAATTVESTARPRHALDRTQHSTSDPASIWVVVNKRHPVSPDYAPDITLVRGYQVASPAAGPLTDLLADSDAQGLGFKIASAYRSYGYQEGVYGNVVAASGQAAADRVSARPGYSEHQTGLAVDLVTPASPVCDFDACFAGTPGGRWLAHHAWRYGFVVRYQPGTEAVTGYSPEPWHLRYVGRPLAAELRRTHVDTLEEFFDITGGDYR
ncbi:M15 family metallopeptidase [Nocardioides sp. CN2-186]|uniref:M15 family metallopeptidase n=1 Tax=Nocardioides tweenelious TaxID=3156607 RepID=UPI0032B566DB